MKVINTFEYSSYVQNCLYEIDSLFKSKFACQRQHIQHVLYHLVFKVLALPWTLSSPPGPRWMWAGMWGWPSPTSPTLAHPAHWTESSITQSRLLGGNLSSVSHTYHHPRSLVGILKKNDSPFLAIALMCSVQPCPSEDVHFKCLRKKISIQKIVLFSCNTTYSNQVFERV